jgi:S1-C subfamily serine protease
MPAERGASLSSNPVEFDDGLGEDPADEAGEDQPDRPLLHPDDRLWRHPSEIARHGLPGFATGAGSPAYARPRSRNFGAFLSGSIGALLVVGLVTAVGGFRTKAVPERSVEHVVIDSMDADAPSAHLTDPIVALADKIHPAVVQVRAYRPEGVLNGTGFLFRTDGFILTSQRVVEDARQVTVTMADLSQQTAEIVGTDPDTGLGVLKIPGKTWFSAPLGTAANLKSGQTAIAIGAPQWVGVGVVASTGTSVQSKDSPLLFDMIELNGTVDPLASGGPMLDGRGAVVGVLDVLDGEGYATPIDIARDVADQLISVGRVAYGYLGVHGSDPDSDLAKRLHLDGGAVIGDIDDGSPAYLAGLHRGDVVTDIESVHITTFAMLEYTVRSFRPGQAVTIKLVRNGQPLSLNATLTVRPSRY